METPTPHRFAGGIRDHELRLEVTTPTARRADLPFYVCLHLRAPTGARVSQEGTSPLDPGEAVIGLPTRYTLRVIAALVRGLLRWRPTPFDAPTR